MLQEPDQVSEKDVEEAHRDLEGCSAELVAACVPDYSAGVVVTLMAQWERDFAATVRQHLDLDSWVHIIDACPDLAVGISWLRSDAELALSKQVVDRIGQLDRSQGQGMHRAAKLMKGLRQAQAPPTTLLPNVAKPTEPTISTATSSSTSNGRSASAQPASPTSVLPPTTSAPPPAIVVSRPPSGEPRSTQTIVPNVPTPTPALIYPLSIGLGAHHEASSRQTDLAQARHLPATSQQSASDPTQDPNRPTPTHSPSLLLPNLPSAHPPSSTAPKASAQSALDPSGTRPSARASTPPVLPSRGKDQRAFRLRPDADAQAGDSFFLKTPVPKSLLEKMDGTPVDDTPEDRPPSPASRVGSTLALALEVPTQPKPPPAPLPPSDSPDKLHPASSHARHSLKRTFEVLIEPLSPEEKSKYTLTPIPRPRRSPTPYDEEDQEESEVDSEDDYLPEPSRKDSAQDNYDAAGDTTEDEEDVGDNDEANDGESGHGVTSSKAGVKNKRIRHPKVIDGKVPTAWTWSKAENDKRLQRWDLEDEIDSNPTVLHPIRTQWMYEARLKDISEEDYDAMMRSEHQELMAIPPACRSFVGKMYYQRAKGDWEVRVVLTCLAWRYAKVKLKKEKATVDGDKESIREHSAEMAKILNTGMRDLFKRFPDLDPKHERRRIGSQLGKAAITAYIQALRTKVSSDAGRMSTAYQKSGGTLAMLDSKSAGRKVLGILDILGKKRKDVAFHLWGGSSSGGREKCDKEISDRMQKWKKVNPSKTPRETSNESLQVVCEVRKTLFQALGVKEQQQWEERAKNLHLPQTDEEQQCLVDAVLPYLFRLLAQLSKHTSLHFVLLASGQGTSNVPVLVHEFSQSTPDQLSFMDENPALAQRVQSDYLTYAISRHNTGQEEVVEGLPVMHTPDETPADPSPNQSPVEPARQLRGSTPIKPFQPNLAVVKSRSQRVAYATTWLLEAGVHVLGYKPAWDFWSKNISKYIAADRLPSDPLVEGKTLEVIKPSMMPDERFDTLWRYLIESYNGVLSEERRFMFRVEALHDEIPAPTAPGDASVHQAAINSTKTVPMKKSGGNGGPKKGRKAAKGPASQEPEDLLDAPGIEEDADAAILDMALADPPRATRRRAGRNAALRVVSPEADDSQSAGGVVPPGGSPPPGGEITPASSPEPEPFDKPFMGEAFSPVSDQPSIQLFGAAASRLTTPGSEIIPSTPQEPESADERAEPVSPVLDGPSIQQPGEAETQAKPKPHLRPRPRGVLPADTDHLAHSTFPGEDPVILERWQRKLADLTSWGRKMGLGPTQGKVLRHRGFVKKDWASLLPTGLESVFCILQMWAARQEGAALLPPISIPEDAGIQGLNPSHPVALAIRRILDPTCTLPTVKLFNVQFGASPAANDGFFDFLEGTLVALVERSAQSEDVFLNGGVDLMQMLRLATYVGGTGFIRDMSTVSEHTNRITALLDRLNIFLASMSLVRYYHVVLRGVAEAFSSDNGIPGREREMWLIFLDAWDVAIRSMARSVIGLRSDLFDWQHLSSILPESLDRMLQTSISLRPWWTHGSSGLPSTVAFTTRQSVASSTLYGTLSLLNWSSLSLLERSQYLLLVFLAAVQIHKGRVPADAPVGIPSAGLGTRSPETYEKMTTYLKRLQAAVEASSEIGEVDPPFNARLGLSNVRSCIDRWESESRTPGIIQIPEENQDPVPAVEKGNEASPTTPVNSLPQQTVQQSSANKDHPTGLPDGIKPLQEAEASITGTGGGRNTSPSPAVESEDAPVAEASPEPVEGNSSASSSSSEVPFEEEDLIWPNGDGPTPSWNSGRTSSTPGAMPPGDDRIQEQAPTEPVIPTIRPAPELPTSAPKPKRQRLIPSVPPNWQVEEKDSNRRQLRSTRPPPAPKQAASSSSRNAASRRRTKKLPVITETQAAINAAASKGQSSRSKRFGA